MGKVSPKLYFHDIPTENITERLIHHLWAEKVFVTYPLKTSDGKSVSISFPGFWNQQEGPDFKQSAIKIRGKSITGDIEIHLYSSDWYRHNHHKDQRYNKVILHVAVWADDKNNYALDSSGRKIPQLIVAEWIGKEYEEIEGFLDANDYTKMNARFGGIGVCSRYCLNESYNEKIKQFLQLCGEKRFGYKKELFKHRQNLLAKPPKGSVTSDYNELAYQGIMEALGYQHNSKAFYELAKVLPLGLLKKIISGINDKNKTLLLQSVFLFQSNLIPISFPDDFNDETKKYLAKIYNTCKKISDKVKLPLTKGKLYWRFKGTRPINYPQRRLAAISYFLSRYLHQGIFKQILNNYSNNTPSLLIDSFNTDLKTEYWLRHSTFGRKKFKKETPLIGEGTLRTIEINVIFPLLSLYAKSERNKKLGEIINQKIRHYPKLPDNHILRSMKYRLFADKTKVMGKFVRAAFDQQSLIQLFKDFCAKGMEGCETCGLVRYVAK